MAKLSVMDQLAAGQAPGALFGAGIIEYLVKLAARISSPIRPA
jgi:hypothetical protein